MNVDESHGGRDFIVGMVVRGSVLGDLYGFDEEDFLDYFEPYHGQVIIHSEELLPN